MRSNSPNVSDRFEPPAFVKFDTLTALPRPAKAVVLAVFLCATARVAFLVWPDAFLTIPESETLQLYLFNEARFRTGQTPSPRVLIMGTSRLGILPPERIAPAAGCAETEVANYALAGNSFWRTLVFFRRNPELLAHARVIILDLLPFQLYQSRIFSENDEVFLRMSTLDERQRVREAGNRTIALADLVFPVWSERHLPGGWLTGVMQLPLAPEQRYHAFMQSAAAVRGYQEALEHGGDAGKTEKAMRGYAPEPKVSNVQVRALEDLLQMIPEQCTLYLVWLPVRADFTAMLEEDAQAKASYDAFRAFIKTVHAPRVRVEWCDPAATPEFTGGDFTDIVHYSEQGIVKTAALLSRLIQQRP